MDKTKARAKNEPDICQKTKICEICVIIMETLLKLNIKTKRNYARFSKSKWTNHDDNQISQF